MTWICTQGCILLKLKRKFYTWDAFFKVQGVPKCISTWMVIYRVHHDVIWRDTNITNYMVVSTHHWCWSWCQALLPSTLARWFKIFCYQISPHFSFTKEFKVRGPRDRKKWNSSKWYWIKLYMPPLLPTAFREDDFQLKWSELIPFCIIYP